jgi:hypothetical protein
MLPRAARLCAARCSRVLTIASLLLVATTTSAQAQSLRQRISDLFIFGEGQEPLFLAGSGDPNNPQSLQVHGEHFIPASSAENGTLISLIGDALGQSISGIPIGSTSGSETFRFEGGVPERTSTSAGAIFAERAATLGKDRLLVGISRTSFSFSTLRGVNMHDIQLTFTHQNVDFPGCSAAVGGDCSKYGIPVVENDVMDFHLSMDLDVAVTPVYVTYGITDRVDVSVVVPLVQANFRGTSNAQIEPFGGTTATHYFAGTPTNPVLSASRQSIGSAAGLGDVDVRGKFNLRQNVNADVAVLVDMRFPTGGTADLLGSGKFTGRVLGIADTHIGSFSPHINAGYLYHAGEQQNDAVLGTVGFDQLMGSRVTLAADLVSALQVGDSKLVLPGVVTWESPFRRSLNPTNIPSTRDDIVDGSFGVKVAPARNTILVLNALFPLNRGGLRPNLAYTVGIERTF